MTAEPNGCRFREYIDPQGCCLIRAYFDVWLHFASSLLPSDHTLSIVTMKGRATNQEKNEETANDGKYEDLLAQHKELVSEYADVFSQYQARHKAPDSPRSNALSSEFLDMTSKIFERLGGLDSKLDRQQKWMEALESQVTHNISSSQEYIMNGISDLSDKFDQQQKPITAARSNIRGDVKKPAGSAFDVEERMKEMEKLRIEFGQIIEKKRLEHDAALAKAASGAGLNFEELKRDLIREIADSLAKSGGETNDHIRSLRCDIEQHFVDLNQRLDEQQESLDDVGQAVRDIGPQKSYASATDTRIDWMLRDLTSHISRLEAKLDNDKQHVGVTEPVEKDTNAHLDAPQMGSGASKNALKSLHVAPSQSPPENKSGLTVSINHFDLNNVGSFNGRTGDVNVFCERIEAAALVYGPQIVLSNIAPCLIDIAHGWYYYELSDDNRHDYLTAATVQPFCSALTYRFLPSRLQLCEDFMKLRYTVQDATNERDIVRFAQQVLEFCKAFGYSLEETTEALQERCDLPLKEDFRGFHEATSVPDLIRFLQIDQPRVWKKYANPDPTQLPTMKEKKTNLPESEPQQTSSPPKILKVRFDDESESDAEPSLPGSWSNYAGPSSTQRANSSAPQSPRPEELSFSPPQSPEPPNGAFQGPRMPQLGNTNSMTPVLNRYSAPRDLPRLVPLQTGFPYPLHTSQDEGLKDSPLDFLPSPKEYPLMPRDFSQAPSTNPFHQPPPVPFTAQTYPTLLGQSSRIPSPPPPTHPLDAPAPEYFDDEEGRWFYDKANNDYFLSAMN